MKRTIYYRGESIRNFRTLHILLLFHMPMHVRRIVGVDEAGRGPLAGPVAVGAVSVPDTFNWSILPYVGDSKRVSPKRREATMKDALILAKHNVLKFHVALIDAGRIDEVGITNAVREGIAECFHMLDHDPWKVQVKLDGLLRAPAAFILQETIIGGDGIEPVIGLASILAKVTRDRFMLDAHLLHPEYGFANHKGYGTELHWKMLRRYGPSPLHRRSFLKNLGQGKPSYRARRPS